MYAIIQTGGKQHKVTNGDVIYVEKLNAQENDQVSFDVLVYSGDGTGVAVGTPLLTDVKVLGKVLGHGKGQKIIVYKYKAKKTQARKMGHRQPYTKVEITSIG